VPADNIDVSALLGRAVHPESAVRVTAGRFLRFLSAFETIHTNRLHVAIAGALLGKTICMYPNRFYKNRAVYEFSLRDRFPNVTWMSQASGNGGEHGAD
jgi:exopolysaccharide biosynthesis predicted pyruvyltransferase EpsI